MAHDGAAVAEFLTRLTADQAHAIGERARRRVLAEHTYAHRARQVAELLDVTIGREAAE